MESKAVKYELLGLTRDWRCNSFTCCVIKATPDATDDCPVVMVGFAAPKTTSFVTSGVGIRGRVDRLGTLDKTAPPFRLTFEPI